MLEAFRVPTEPASAAILSTTAPASRMVYVGESTAGALWPNPIPFTGAKFLAIMPDGRTLEAGDVPVRWAQEARNAAGDPVSLGNGSAAAVESPSFTAQDQRNGSTNGYSSRQLRYEPTET